MASFLIAVFADKGRKQVVGLSRGRLLSYCVEDAFGCDIVMLSRIRKLQKLFQPEAIPWLGTQIYNTASKSGGPCL